MFDVITIGSATRDVFVASDELRVISSSEFQTGQAFAIGLGSKIELSKIVLTTGGGGSNTAVTFARQGFQTSCISVIGQDKNGEMILDDLKKEGVDTSYLQKHDDQMSAYSVILVDGGGERSILSYKGEGQHFESATIQFAELESGWAFVSSVGGHIEMLEAIIKWATDKNIKLAINPGTKDLALGGEKLMPLLKSFAIVSMNQEEAGKLFSVDYSKELDIFKKADKSIGGIFIMSNGHEGVKVSDGKNIYSAGVPDSPIVERTGAGDAFASGFVAEYIRQTNNQQPTTNNEEAIRKAIQFGTANASSVVTQFGAKAGILKKGDTGPWPLVDVGVTELVT